MKLPFPPVPFTKPREIRRVRVRAVASWPRLRQNERRTSRTRQERGAARRSGKMMVFVLGESLQKCNKMASTSEYFLKLLYSNIVKLV